MRKFFIHIDGQPQGPFTIEELAKMQINRFTYVWADDFDDWKQAGEVGELTSILVVTPPPFTHPHASPVKNVENQQLMETTPRQEEVQMQEQQPQQDVRRRPDTHMTAAVIATLFFCLPLGLVSIIAANDVSTLYGAGDYQGALEASTKASRWANISFVAGILLYIIVLFFYFGNPTPPSEPVYTY